MNMREAITPEKSDTDTMNIDPARPFGQANIRINDKTTIASEIALLFSNTKFITIAP